MLRGPTDSDLRGIGLVFNTNPSRHLEKFNIGVLPSDENKELQIMGNSCLVELAARARRMSASCRGIVGLLSVWRGFFCLM